jgi:hypothetical protein
MTRRHIYSGAFGPYASNRHVSANRRAPRSIFGQGGPGATRAHPSSTAPTHPAAAPHVPAGQNSRNFTQGPPSAVPPVSSRSHH